MPKNLLIIDKEVVRNHRVNAFKITDNAIVDINPAPGDVLTITTTHSETGVVTVHTYVLLAQRPKEFIFEEMP